MIKSSDNGKTKIRKAIKYRLEESALFNKSEIKQEVNQLKKETSKYTAFRTSVVQNLTSELDGCAAVVIEPDKALIDFYNKLINDTSFNTVFDVKEEKLGRKKVYRISYLVFDE